MSSLLFLSLTLSKRLLVLSLQSYPTVCLYIWQFFVVFVGFFFSFTHNIMVAENFAPVSSMWNLEMKVFNTVDTQTETHSCSKISDRGFIHLFLFFVWYCKYSQTYSIYHVHPYRTLRLTSFLEQILENFRRLHKSIRATATL